MATSHPSRTVSLIGAPVQHGAGQLGCAMGSTALRVAGLQHQLEQLGCSVTDLGDVSPETVDNIAISGAAKHPELITGWTRALEKSAFNALSADAFPVFLGGDHSLSMGTVSGAARFAAAQGRPLFVLWLDAHSDFNTPMTSPSGNMHGMPVAFFCGEPGFAEILPQDRALVDAKNVTMVGVRSIDRDERTAVKEAGISVYDMRAIDEHGIVPIVRELLQKVEAANGLLHVSLDVDYLDPEIAPGVGTTVRGGATYREAHLVMELLHDSGRVSSMDLVELNPFLDERGKSAILLVELVASLFGQQIFENPSRRPQTDGFLWTDGSRDGLIAAQ